MPAAQEAERANSPKSIEEGSEAALVNEAGLHEHGVITSNQSEQVVQIQSSDPSHRSQPNNVTKPQQKTCPCLGSDIRVEVREGEGLCPSYWAGSV